jgi:hypothetical protein
MADDADPSHESFRGRRKASSIDPDCAMAFQKIALDCIARVKLLREAVDAYRRVKQAGAC